MADQNLRKFRRAVALLKKQGLITGTTVSGGKIDARAAVPSWKIKGKKLSTLVRKYDDVVSGKLTAVKVPPTKLQEFRMAGFETANHRVLVPHSKTEVAKFKGGKIKIQSTSGTERVPIPVEFYNLKQYLKDTRANAKVINRMKERNEFFGIRFFGGQRAFFYENIDLLLDDLERYESIEQAYGSRAKEQDVYSGLEIIKLNKKGMREVSNRISARNRQDKKQSKIGAKKRGKRRKTTKRRKKR